MAVFLAAGLCRAQTPAGEIPAAATGEVDLVWHRDLETALSRAEAEYRPVLAVFSSPGCGWCQRLKTETLDDPETRNLLKHYALVEIDVMDDPLTAQQYGLRGVPTVLILSSDGQVRNGVSGYVSVPELCAMLRGELNPEFMAAQDTGYQEMIMALDRKQVPDELWPRILAGMGEPAKRKDLRERVFALKPFPAVRLVALLEDPKLAVRLGALELLEELAGPSFGFDPWQPPGGNAEALQRWKEWVSGAGGAVEKLYAALSVDEIRACLEDLVSEHRDRALRAMRLLEQGGPGTAEAVAAFLAGHPDLPAGARGRIREVRYVLALPGTTGVDVRALAHRLVFGNLDARLRALQDLPRFRSAAVPVLAEFLLDPEPIVRETAVDSLVKSSARQAVDLLARHLETEKDQEVIFSVLRAFGDMPGKKSVALLTLYLSDPNEDLVIAALQSLGRLKSQTAVEQVGQCLADPRWRVRAAALEAAGKMSARSLSDPVLALVDDPDEFIRFAAIGTLAELGVRKAAGRLEKLFLEQDKLKGPVIRALLQMELTLPLSFKAALEGRGADVLLPVIDAIAEDGETKDLFLVAPLTAHADLDVACAAIRLIGGKGMTSPVYRKLLAEILRKGPAEKALAALESMEVEEEQVSWADESASFDFGVAEPEAETPAGNKELEELFAAFKPAAEPPKPQASTEVVDVLDVLGAFGLGPSRARTPPARMAAGPDPLEEAIRPYADPSQDGRTRFAAALLLAAMGRENQASFLQGSLAERTEDERMRIAQSLRPRLRGEYLPLLGQLVNDPSPNVRVAAAYAAIDRGGGRGLDLVLSAMERPDGRLHPKEIYGYRVESALRRPEGRRIARDFAQKFIGQTNRAPLRVLGVLLLHKSWRRTDPALVRPLLTDADPWVRRAAYHALGQNDRKSFQEVLKGATEDPSEYVREVVPQTYTRSMTRWVHYFSKDDFEEDYSYWSAQGQKPRPQPAELEALKKLAADPEPRVRLAGLLALLSNRQPVDLADVVRAAEAVPDRRAVAERIGRYLADNYLALGAEFALLLPYLEEGDQNESMKEKVRRHFEKKTGGVLRAADLPVLAVEGRRVEASFEPEPEGAVTNATAPGVRLVFFTSYGCRECENVKAMLPRLREVFPGLQVDVHDIRKASAMGLNEALCERFGVPERIRLVTPALFARAGYSIKEDISFARLGELLARSAGGDDEWCRVPEQELEQAAASIGGRYREIRLGVIAAAGLLDGLNPCAFATIIFLLSYLQVTKRTPRQIAQVGLAFIAGVFLAYYVLGLGLVELVARFEVLRRFGRLVNGLLAAFTLVIAALSARDGFRCLRGRMVEMTLQLPGFLKDRIHGVIRKGARHARFVAAAFAAGLVVSALELACTGQVYAPTILFMLKTGEERLAAMGYLLAYNAAFVAPLFVVFALAMAGLRSEALIRFMHRRAAAVKFATAGLFLILFLVFVWSFRT